MHARSSGLAASLRSVFVRRHETVRAVDEISFSIPAGERVGFLGPNGAGKTTTLKMLAGLLVPSGGRVEVGGYYPADRRPEFLSRVMLVTGQKNQLLWDLPPADTFELNRAIYGVPREVYRRRLDELVALLDLSSVMRKPSRQLSLGERMKCELAAALIHGPMLLFLDEPTIGLDVTMQAQVRRFIKAYNEEHGATVLLTSHNMDDVAAICERVLIIDHGKLLFDGTLASLVTRMRPDKRVSFTFASPVDPTPLVAFGKVVERAETGVTMQVPSAEVRPLIETALRLLPVVDMTAENAPLEEVLADLFARASEPGRSGSEAAG